MHNIRLPHWLNWYISWSLKWLISITWCGWSNSHITGDWVCFKVLHWLNWNRSLSIAIFKIGRGSTFIEPKVVNLFSFAIRLAHLVSRYWIVIREISSTLGLCPLLLNTGSNWVEIISCSSCNKDFSASTVRFFLTHWIILSWICKLIYNICLLHFRFWMLLEITWQNTSDFDHRVIHGITLCLLLISDAGKCIVLYNRNRRHIWLYRMELTNFNSMLLQSCF